MKEFVLDFDVWYIRYLEKVGLFNRETYRSDHRTKYDYEVGDYRYVTEEFNTDLCTLSRHLMAAWLAVAALAVLVLLVNLYVIPLTLYEIYTVDFEGGERFSGPAAIGIIIMAIYIVTAIIYGIKVLKDRGFFNKPLDFCISVCARISSLFALKEDGFIKSKKQSASEVLHKWNEAHKEKYCAKITLKSEKD